MSTERCRVRWFVASHLTAVGMLYALALGIGGGWAEYLPPDQRVAAASTVPAVPALAAAPAARTPELPDWVQRPELSSPWELR